MQVSLAFVHHLVFIYGTPVKNLVRQRIPVHIEILCERLSDPGDLEHLNYHVPPADKLTTGKAQYNRSKRVT